MRPPAAGDSPAEAGQILSAAATAIHEIRKRELADERPAAEAWEQILAGLHQVLSASDDLMEAIGNGCPLYAVPAQWRDGVDPPRDVEPAVELIAAGGEIVRAQAALHDPKMQLTLARRRIGQLTFNHDQPSIWDNPST
jgi:hypothetical protein